MIGFWHLSSSPCQQLLNMLDHERMHLQNLSKFAICLPCGRNQCHVVSSMKKIFLFQECWQGMYAEHPDHFGSSQRSVSKQQTRPEGCHKEHFLKSSVINSLSLSSVTNVFTRKRLYSLQTIFFTQKNLSSKVPLRKTFTQRSFYTENFLHRKTFTHKKFRSQNISHKAVSTHKCLYT